MTTPAPATPARQRSETVVVFALSLAAMVVSMMQTLVVPILGLIQSDLETTPANVSWVTTATLLSAAVFTPLLGRFGDQHGKKQTLVGVLVVMVAGSVLAATTHSLLWLIVGRVLQGAATAIFPLALSVLREEIRPARLPGAMALVSGTLAFGSGLALVAVGLLTSGDHPDYRSAFWLATGLAALALIAVATLVPATRETTGGRTDVLGALTLAATLVLLLLPVSQGHEWGWSSGRTLGCFAGAVIMAVVWTLVERKVKEPLVDMRMFAHRPVLFANLAGLLVGFGSFALFIGVSYLVQMPSKLTGYGFDASILRASVEFLLPGTLVSLLAAPVGGKLVRQHGPRPVLYLASLAGALGFAWLVVDHDHAFSVIAGGMLVGAGISFGYAAMPAVIVGSVPPHQTGIANGINSISRSTGSAIGSAMVTTVLASKSVEHLPPGLPKLPAESQFTLTFVIAAAAFALVSLVAALGLRTIHTLRSTAVAGSAPAADAETAGAGTADATR
ncbi:MFS transporter [Streptomyces mobaraensis NBRC 13819 = DSM 40847]|uniref:Membrane transport protein n=1 Tax=Streptomyces mobaraensis (strain ATCC 29032 / DSM 40847 / JCM 4168 / NBRC 13819 / NCIMB 11159 / IPCR 16-22) TaxID=1223523 RepID=M3B0T8_STRM1|nr:MFS transporter [Streptomyces mobaraensis]EME99532.1 membrane transport protein [Streptomyces mobaraensis NBRC 13819 = DSM 40847]QTT73090.1 MFS transporter [Streptomyces mobaraensis NBRC 13819 = DSM 40847]